MLDPRERCTVTECLEHVAFETERLLHRNPSSSAHGRRSRRQSAADSRTLSRASSVAHCQTPNTPVPPAEQMELESVSPDRRQGTPAFEPMESGTVRSSPDHAPFFSDAEPGEFLRFTRMHPFNDPLSGTTQVSRYQEGKTNLDFTEARDSEWQWHQLGHMQVCTSLQTDNNASTPPLSFFQAGCPSCRPTNSVKALKENYISLENAKKLRYLCSGWPIITKFGMMMQNVPVQCTAVKMSI